MGPVAAVRILHRRKLAAVPEEERHALEERLAAEHEKIAGGLERAHDLGVIDEVIDPAKTRRAIAQAIAEATPARGAHSNIPL
jgi:acetyl-CoA/propionyl-CoA carboxylase carboxyl transferase subunit